MELYKYKEIIKREFEAYTSDYDPSDDRIALKVEHTYKVASIAEDIASTISELSDKEVLFCWLLGMLHDIGRFEQLARYGTFLDADSVDHAELGADILFKENLIDHFWQEPVTDMQPDDEWHMIELAIRQHNKYKIQTDLEPKEALFCNILRDADKVDIFRVIQEIPFEVRMTKRDEKSDDPAREEVMQCVRNHTCVPRLANRSSFESQIAGCAMAFELVYERSRQLAREQGNLKDMLSYEPKNQRQKEQMEELRKEISYIC